MQKEVTSMGLEMKKCKECGKLFTPKSAQSVYCDDIHFRPCPVCGKAVEAKYLSDPARCCSKECSAVARAQKKEAEKAKTIESVLNPMKAFDPSTNNTHSVTVTIDKNRDGKGVRTLFAMPQDIQTVPDDFIPMPKPETPVKKLKQLSEDTEHATALRKNYPVRTYVGTPTLGFEPGHEYALDIDKDDRNILYVVTAIYDFTEGKDIDIVIHLSSQISINQNFAQL